MKYLLILLLLFAFNVQAMEIQYDGEIIQMSDKYSGKNFSKVDLTHDAGLEQGTNIYGSNFYKEARIDDVNPVKEIFPIGMRGVTFYNCNLDNVFVPPFNTVIGGSNRKIKVQNDGEDWILDNAFKPVEPMDIERRKEFDVSFDPKDIPVQKFTKEEKEQHEEDYYGPNRLSVISP